MLAAAFGGPSKTWESAVVLARTMTSCLVVEIEIGPAQHGQLASAQPAQGGQPPQCVEPI